MLQYTKNSTFSIGFSLDVVFDGIMTIQVLNHFLKTVFKCFLEQIVQYDGYAVVK
jgi:hypothetical protein